MGVIIEGSTLARARSVVEIVKQIWEAEGDEDSRIFLDAYYAKGYSGLKLSTFDGTAVCNIIGANNSDGFFVNLGSVRDFDPASGATLDTATHLVFGFEEAQEAANAIVRFLKDPTLEIDPGLQRRF